MLDERIKQALWGAQPSSIINQKKPGGRQPKRRRTGLPGAIILSI